jgi:apolipoprotein D and lipocalin family protein
MKKLILVLSFLFCGTLSVSASARDIPTVDYVDLQKYIGTWHEVASIPQSFQKDCIANTTADYSILPNGLIKVVNSCDTVKGTRKVADGRARIVDSKSNSKLKVTFVKFIDWIFAFGGRYWILDLAPDYSYALIGEPSLKYAWILSRSPSFSAENFAHAEAKFKSLGYDTCKILTSVQTGGVQQRIPLCNLH